MSDERHLSLESHHRRGCLTGIEEQQRRRGWINVPLRLLHYCLVAGVWSVVVRNDRLDCVTIVKFDWFGAAQHFNRASPRVLHQKDTKPLVISELCFCASRISTFGAIESDYLHGGPGDLKHLPRKPASPFLTLGNKRRGLHLFGIKSSAAVIGVALRNPGLS